MGDRMYDHGRNAFARGELAWRANGGSVFRAVFVDPQRYRPDTERHRFLSDIPDAARCGHAGSPLRLYSPRLALRDPVAGVCDAEDTVFLAVPPGTDLGLVVVFADDGHSDATSPLVLVTEPRGDRPMVGDGGDVEVAWDDGPNKVFKL